MTKREILNRLVAAHNGHGNGYDAEGLRRLRLDLAGDVDDEETPREAEDVKPGPRRPGPIPEPPPTPRAVVIILPPGVRALIEAENQ